MMSAPKLERDGQRQCKAELLPPSASDCAWLRIDEIPATTQRLSAAGNIVREASGNKIT